MMTDCLEIRPMLVALIDGELDHSQQNTVRTHLETCAECRSANDDYLNVGGLAAASHAADTVDIWHRVDDEIRRSEMADASHSELHALRTEVAVLRDEIAALRQQLRSRDVHSDSRRKYLGLLDRQPLTDQQFRLV